MRRAIIWISFLLLIVYLIGCASQAEKTEVGPSYDLKKFTRYIQQGNEMMKKGQYNEAIEKFRQASGTNPEAAEPYNMIGICHFQLGIFHQAKDAFQQAISMNPSFAAAYNNLGTVYYAQSNYEEAIKAYEEALKLNPKIASAYHNLGNIYLAQNKTDQAIEYYKKAFKIKPDYLTASQTNLARLERTKGKGEAEYSYACVLASLGKVEEALHFLEKAIDKGFSDWDRIKNEPDFQGIKDNPRFQKLISEK